MRLFHIIFFALLFNSSFSQIDKIKGRWILDFVTYDNGQPLEIEHPLFSTFKKLGNSTRICYN